jgi:3-oxoacyl-[acyl-carrier-protein] synthase III
VTFIQSVGLLLPSVRRTTPDEVASASAWRAVCEAPGQSPADMAIRVGSTTLGSSGTPPADVDWLIHCGSGYQGGPGWPVHHHIQHRVIGRHGNALELRQLCAGGLTSWLVADGFARSGCTVVCTGSDNWSWDDRFAASRALGGEPFSDAAHAAVLSPRAGFAKLLGSATASCPEQESTWRTRENFWEHATMVDLQQMFARVPTTRTTDAARDSFDMLVYAVAGALKDAQISPQYVTHFVPHASCSGEPYRSLAKAIDLPWAESLHENNLDRGYLGVSTHASGLIDLAECGSLDTGSIVLLLAAEYQLSATAVVLGVTRRPELSADGPVQVLHG